MIGNNESATNKIDNYSNIKVSVEKVEDEKMKQDAITALNSFSDEELQKIDSYSEKLDVILKNMEFYNSVTDDSRSRYSEDPISSDIIGFFFGYCSKIADINLEIVGFIIKHRISIPFIFQASDFNEVREEVNLVLKNTEFAKFLLAKGFMDSFFCGSSFVENRTLSEGLNACIENQDLLLINYLMNDRILETACCSDRKSMIDELYEIQKEDNTKWAKEKLDLMLLNSKIIQQLLYANIDSNNKEDYSDFGYQKYRRLVCNLRSNTYEEMKTFINHASVESLEQFIKQNINDGFGYTGGLLIAENKSKDILKLEALSARTFMGSNESFVIDYVDKQIEYKKSHAKDVENKARQREVQLANPQATPAISDQQYITQ